MFGIPEWAIGVVAIVAGVGVVQILVGLGYKVLGLPRRDTRSRARAVLGMTLPGESGERSDSGEHAAALQDVQRRIAELEERVDFAERLLAQHKDAAQLNPPGK
jgi:Tfp pilus assembly protein PilO